MRKTKKRNTKRNNKRRIKRNNKRRTKRNNKRHSKRNNKRRTKRNNKRRTKKNKKRRSYKGGRGWEERIDRLKKKAHTWVSKQEKLLYNYNEAWNSWRDAAPEEKKAAYDNLNKIEIDLFNFIENNIKENIGLKICHENNNYQPTTLDALEPNNYEDQLNQYVSDTNMENEINKIGDEQKKIGDSVIYYFNNDEIIHTDKITDDFNKIKDDEKVNIQAWINNAKTLTYLPYAGMLTLDLINECKKYKINSTYWDKYLWWRYIKATEDKVIINCVYENMIKNLNAENIKIKNYYITMIYKYLNKKLNWDLETNINNLKIEKIEKIGDLKSHLEKFKNSDFSDYINYISDYIKDISNPNNNVIKISNMNYIIKFNNNNLLNKSKELLYTTNQKMSSDEYKKHKSKSYMYDTTYKNNLLNKSKELLYTTNQKMSSDEYKKHKSKSYMYDTTYKNIIEIKEYCNKEKTTLKILIFNLFCNNEISKYEEKIKSRIIAIMTYIINLEKSIYLMLLKPFIIPEQNILRYPIDILCEFSKEEE